MAGHRAVGAELASLTRELQGMTDFCQDLLTRVDGASSRVAAEWSSDAAAKFQTMHAIWAAGAAKMSAGALTITTSAADAHAAYGDVADLHSKAWS